MNDSRARSDHSLCSMSILTRIYLLAKPSELQIERERKRTFLPAHRA